MDISTLDLDTIIQNCKIDEVCNPHTGDCVSVAVAIKSVFGGEYVCGYQTPSDKTPAHATVDIDGILYDGGGATSMEVLYDICISGLKSTNIESPDDHIHSVQNLQSNAYYDQDIKQQVEKRLQNELENHLE